MGVITTLTLIVLGILGAALSRQLTDEFKAWTPRIIERLIGLAIRKLPVDERERFSEEWRSYVNEIPGEIGKLLSAAHLLQASWQMRRITAENKGVADQDLPRLEVEFYAEANGQNLPRSKVEFDANALECYLDQNPTASERQCMGEFFSDLQLCGTKVPYRNVRDIFIVALPSGFIIGFRRVSKDTVRVERISRSGVIITNER